MFEMYGALDNKNNSIEDKTLARKELWDYWCVLDCSKSILEKFQSVHSLFINWLYVYGCEDVQCL